ncbi:MAG: EpsI family protein [Phycisphaerae bacterium]|nr:EpsI family protein [Phycisphaerae bacterium]
MEKNAKRSSVIVAAAVAFALVVGAGAAYRLAAGRLARPSAGLAIPRGTLERRLPLQIGPWQGAEVPLDPAIVRTTDADDLVNREYVRSDGQAVALFIAYGVRARDLMPHRPEVCYPGAGWTVDDTETVDLKLPDDTTRQVRIHRFFRPGLSNQQITVLNYYIVDGRYSPDVSLLRSMAWRGAGGVRYVAQVQITASSASSRSSQAALDAIRDFAVAVDPHIAGLLPDATTTAPVSEADHD